HLFMPNREIFLTSLCLGPPMFISGYLHFSNSISFNTIIHATFLLWTLCFICNIHSIYMLYCNRFYNNYILNKSLQASFSLTFCINNYLFRINIPKSKNTSNNSKNSENANNPKDMFFH